MITAAASEFASASAAAPAAPPAPGLLDQLGLAYVLGDRAGRIVEVNRAFLALSGYDDAAALLGQSYHDLFSPRAEREQRRTAYLQCIEREELAPHYERAFATRTGAVRLVHWDAGFARDADGRVAGIWVAGREQADRSVAPHTLAGNPTNIQDFLDNAQDLVLHLSADNNFFFVNKAWKDKLGYSDDELASRTLADVVHPYYRAKLLYQLRNLYEGEPVNKVETVLLTKSGRPVHLIGSLSRVPAEDGQPASFRAILHDITDRIKAERLQKVYYSIANLAISARDLPALYAAIHRELGKIIETNNLYIALCDEERTQLQFAYFVDQHPQNPPLVRRPFSSGLSEYIIGQGQPRHLTRDELHELVRDGQLTAFGQVPEVLLAAPLSVGERTIGVLVVQDYERPEAYAPGDVDILHFISSQVALAIDRKGQEERLAKQNARLNAIFESGTHLMWSVDLRGRLVSFNRNYAAFYLRRNGVMPTRGLNLRQADLVRMEPDASRAFLEHYEAAARGQAQRFEVRLVDTRGQDVWTDVHLNPIYLGDGTFEEISAIAQDITEQKSSQLALAAQEEKFRSIFESFQDIYYRTDDQGLLTIISPSVQEVLGYAPAEVLGQPVADYYHDPAQRAEVVAEVQRTGALRNFETQMRHKDGHPVTVLINARRSAQGQAGTEGIARDVTEMRRMQDDLRHAKESAEAALAAKTQFLANMSHELRTPMNGIIGMIDLLAQTPTDAEQTEYVDTLRKSSDALLTILNDILDLSKVQAGKLRLHEAPLYLPAVLERIHSLFSYRATQKHLRFTYHLTSHTPTHVVTDEVRLLQILSNLVANAIKFTNQGTVSVVVSSVVTDGEVHTLRFVVQDSGIGIAPDDAARLFTSFTQLDTTPTKAFGGTGLGLAISKELAALLGGDIGVISDVGEGSTFWFTIRCRAAAEGAAPLPAEPAAAEAPPALRLVAAPAPGAAEAPAEVAPHILLVDDNLINQKVAGRLLAKLGCDVDVAADGYEAIARATAPGAGYHLIFMDIQMPGLDGVEATRAIKAALGAACPPVVAMTAYSMPDDATRFVEAGLDDYLAKPVKQQRLYEVISRWIGPCPAHGETEPAAPPAPAAPPMLDLDVLAQLRQLGGAEFTAELYQEFEQETAALLAQAAPLVAAADYPAVLPLLHQLKGTAATLGLTAVAGQAKLLEHNLKSGVVADAPAGFQLLQHYFAQFAGRYPEAVAAPAPAAE